MIVYQDNLGATCAMLECDPERKFQRRFIITEPVEDINGIRTVCPLAACDKLEIHQPLSDSFLLWMQVGNNVYYLIA